MAFLTDPRGPDPECVARALPAGAALILRHYGCPRRVGFARRLREITTASGVMFLVGADPTLAAIVSADGVHWRADQLRAGVAPSAGLISTAACHGAEDLDTAARAGVAAAFLSPVFATQSHPGAEYLQAEKFRALAAASAIPVFALGGVDERNAALIRGRNVAGFGAISAFATRLE